MSELFNNLLILSMAIMLVSGSYFLFKLANKESDMVAAGYEQYLPAHGVEPIWRKACQPE